MTKKIIIDIPSVPPSANRVWRNASGLTYLSPETRAFNKLVKYVLRETIPKEWKFYRVEIVVFPQRRSGDVDNRIKPVLDALTKACFWEDDTKVAFVSCQFAEVDKKGRTQVIITEAKKKFGLE